MPLPRAVVVLQSPELYLDGLRRRERRGGCGDRVVGVLRAVARRRRGRSAAGVVEGKDGGGVPPAVPMQRTRRLLGEFSLSHKVDRSAWNFVVCRNPSIGSTRKRRGGRRPRAERSWRHEDRLSKKSNSSLRQQSIFFSVRRRPASKRKKQNENCSVPYKGAHSCVPSSVAQHSRTLFLLSHRFWRAPLETRATTETAVGLVFSIMSPPPSLPPPPPLLSASALASARLGGKLTADLVMRSPQYMNCLGDYEIDLRGKKVERRT